MNKRLYNLSFKSSVIKGLNNTREREREREERDNSMHTYTHTYAYIYVHTYKYVTTIVKCFCIKPFNT